MDSIGTDGGGSGDALACQVANVVESSWIVIVAGKAKLRREAQAVSEVQLRKCKNVIGCARVCGVCARDGALGSVILTRFWNEQVKPKPGWKSSAYTIEFDVFGHNIKSLPKSHLQSGDNFTLCNNMGGDYGIGIAGELIRCTGYRTELRRHHRQASQREECKYLCTTRPFPRPERRRHEENQNRREPPCNRTPNIRAASGSSRIGQRRP